MMKISFSNSFKKQYKLQIKRGKKPEKLSELLEKLANKEKLPPKYNDHTLIGNFKGFRELCIEPDWLLIYRILDDEIILEKTGTHSDLFGL